MRLVHLCSFCLLLIIPFSVFSEEASYSDAKTLYSYSVTMGEGEKKTEFSLKLEYFETKTDKIYLWENKTEGRQSISFSKKTKQTTRSFYEVDGSLLNIFYDYDKKTVTLNKAKGNTVFSLAENLNASETLFFLDYIKGAKLKLGETGEFELLIPKASRINRMKFTYVSNEEIKAGNKTLKAMKFEMSLSNFFEALFWPHSYYFWYDAETHIILRYEGPEKDGTQKIIQVQSKFL